MSGTRTQLVEKSGRMSAEERRDEVLNAAIIEFAMHGLYGASTEVIAARVGISQPYIFRLFGTKKELFMAATSVVCKRICSSFEEALRNSTEPPLAAMGHSFKKLLSGKQELRLLLQAFSASEDPEVQAEIRSRYEFLIDYVKEKSGASDQDIMEFFAYGMLLTVGAVIDSDMIMRMIKNTYK